MSKSISNYKKLNKKLFSKIKSDAKILLEFNNWQPLHISFSYLANFLANKFNASIVSYPGYKLISEELESPFIKKLNFI